MEQQDYATLSILPIRIIQKGKSGGKQGFGLNIFFSPALSAPQPLPRSGEVFSEVVASAVPQPSCRAGTSQVWSLTRFYSVDY